MRKVTLALVLAFCLLSTYSFSAFASTASSPRPTHPQALGGGCGTTGKTRTGDMSGEACINFDGTYLNSDSYITFRPIWPQGYISSCKVQIITFMYGFGSVALNQYNCVIAASNDGTDVHFGPDPAYSNWQYLGEYYDNAIVTLRYSGGVTSVLQTPAAPYIYLD